VFCTSGKKASSGSADANDRSAQLTIDFAPASLLTPEVSDAIDGAF
jgi:hypothetical protein